MTPVVKLEVEKDNAVHVIPVVGVHLYYITLPAQLHEMVDDEKCTKGHPVQEHEEDHEID